MIKGYRDLLTYQKAYALALDLHRTSLSFPRFEQMELASQLRRASKSVAMNIAEGYAKRESLNEMKRFLGIARGSNDEVQVQLSFCKDLGYIDHESFLAYESRSIEVGKMISSMLTNWKNFK